MDKKFSFNSLERSAFVESEWQRNENVPVGEESANKCPIIFCFVVATRWFLSVISVVINCRLRYKLYSVRIISMD